MMTIFWQFPVAADMERLDCGFHDASLVECSRLEKVWAGFRSLRTHATDACSSSITYPLMVYAIPNPFRMMASPSASASANKPPVTQISQSPPLLIKKLSASAKAPMRGSAFAAGYDIYASKATTVPQKGKILVDTDIAIAVPEGTCKSLPSVPEPSYCQMPALTMNG